MSDQRGGGITWTDETWNPVRGCSRVSEGCRECYAEKIAGRFSGPGQPFEGLAVLDERGARWTGEVRLIEERLSDPFRWRRPRRVFVNSMSDLFHEKLDWPTIARVFAVMAAESRHQFQVLTKRAARMREVVSDEAFRVEVERLTVARPGWPLPNVWLGVSVENQEAADERIPDLLATPAAVRWLSVEPMLGPVDLSKGYGSEEWIDWVVCGGESGPGAREMKLEWARLLRDRCAAARIPFHFKQVGSIGFDGRRRAKRANGRELDGRTWDEFPRASEAAGKVRT